MKKQLTAAAIAAVAFSIGFGFNKFAMSEVPTNFKVAVIDVSKVVNQSTQVQSLKKEQETKMQELQKWITTAREDVAKQSTEENKQKLAKKYDADFAKKKQAIRKDYTSKLKEIDKNISSVIVQQAKAKNYNLVLSKGVVLYGGEDITQEISKAVK